MMSIKSKALIAERIMSQCINNLLSVIVHAGNQFAKSFCPNHNLAEDKHKSVVLGSKSKWLASLNWNWSVICV